MIFTSMGTCNDTMLHMSKCRCKRTVNGHHEPNLVMKDNDLKYKLSLPPDEALDIYTQIRRDSKFLMSVGVMDYSLLCK